MFNRHKLIVPTAILMYTASAVAGTVSVYAVSTNYNDFTGQFGTVDLTTGAFNPIGPVTSDPLTGLLPQPNGNLLALSVSGNLDSVNPASGAISVIGATGLGGLAYSIAELNGTLYATDLYSNIYTINPTTATASLLGPTGLPICPSLTDPNDISDETLFTAGGKLYATFDALDLTSLAVLDSPELYQIDPGTGAATPLGPTALGLDAAVQVNGTILGFDFGYAGSNTVLALDLANGKTTFVADYETSPVAGGVNAFDIVGASPTPEPASFTLAGIATGLAFVTTRRKRRERGRRL